MSIINYITGSAAYRWVVRNILTKVKLFWIPKAPINSIEEIVFHLSNDRFYAWSCFSRRSLASRAVKFFLGDKSRYSHSGVLLGDVESPRSLRVFHITADGPMIETLESLLKRIDYFTLVELIRQKDKAEVARWRTQVMIERIDQLIYDFQFDLENAENILYCSELVRRIGVGLVTDPDFLPAIKLDKKVFTPDKVVQSGKIIYTNHPNERVVA